MEISRGGGGGGRDDPGRMTPAQRHDENPERHAGRSQGRNERRKNFAAALLAGQVLDLVPSRCTNGGYGTPLFAEHFPVAGTVP